MVYSDTVTGIFPCVALHELLKIRTRKLFSRSVSLIGFYSSFGSFCVG